MTNIRSIAKKTLTFSSGNLGGILVGIVAFPLLSKIYSPVEFGQYSLALYSIGVVAAIATLRLELALASTVDETQAGHILMAGVFLPVLFGFLTLMGSIMVTRGNKSATFFAFSFFYVCGFAWITLLTAWFVRLNDFLFAGNLSLIYSASILVFQLILPRQMGEDGLYAGNILGGILAVAFPLVYKRKKIPFFLLAKPNLSTISDVLRHHKGVLGLNTVQSVTNAFSLAFLSHGVSLVGGLSAVGFFATCQRILVVPVRLLGNAMRQSLLQGLAVLALQDARALAIRATIILIPISVVTFSALLFLLPLGVDKFMASEWGGVKQFIAPLSAWLAITIIYVPAIALLNVYKKVWPHVAYEVLNLLARAIILFVAMLLTWDAIVFVWISSGLSLILGVALCVVAFAMRLDRDGKHESY